MTKREDEHPIVPHTRVPENEIEENSEESEGFEKNEDRGVVGIPTSTRIILSE